MKRLLGYFLSFLFIISSFSFNINSVHAADEHKFSLIAYDCNTLNAQYKCLGPNNNVNEPLNVFTSNSNVQPEKIIKISLYYIPGSVTDISMQLGVKYDKTLVEPVYYKNSIWVEKSMKTTSQGGIWPPVDEIMDPDSTNWQIQANDVTASSMVKFIISDSLQEADLTTEGVLASIFFKVKEDAASGSVITFSYDDSFSKLSKNTPKITSGITLNVFGNMSNNKALSTLDVKNGTTNYTLTPTFVAGSTENKDFETVVPNQITNVDIEATTTDSTTTITSGTGNKTLNVGTNNFSILVTAQNGETETYKVKVYRLSNDASLSTLSLSNGVNIGTFSPTTLNYSAVVPYSTSTTTITATKNHEFAQIKTDLTSAWDLTNTGATKNIKEIEVNAENCLEEYNTVPGNTCTTNKYKLEVTRTAPSSNADLATLKIDGTSVPSFSANTINYTLPDVTIAQTSVNVQATVADVGKATITTTLGNKSLSTGNNEIKVIVKAEDGTTKTYTVNIKQLSNDSKLKILSVTSAEGGTFGPPFSSTVYNYYTFTAPSTATNATISATVNDTGKATIVSGIGSFDIDQNPSVNVTVQAEDGTQSIYVVKLVREKSSNAYLKSLSIDGYSINETFVKTDTLYTANVSGNVTSVTINAEVEDTGKATIVSGTGSHNLVVGPNTIQVRVKAENNATKDYTITITRAPKTESALTDLTIDGTTITGFNEKTLEYTITDHYPFNKTQIEIGATKKDSDSTVTGIGTMNLKTGDNILYVIVTAQDGKTQTSYVINLYREKDTNAYLEYLKIDSKLIDEFSKTKTTYNITVPNSVKLLDLSTKAESNSASIVVTGNSDFLTTKNNVVTITVTAEAGNVEIYKINVTREKSENNYLKSITLSDGLLDPVFVKTTQKYNVSVDRSVTSITITPEVEDSTATATVSGPSSLIIGDNVFEITVKNEKNINDRVYEITVTRNPSNNNYLSDLTIDSKTVTDFSSTKELYTMSVASTKESVTIGAQVAESHASVVIRKQGDLSTTSIANKNFDLVTGVNTFEIVVTAEDTKTRTYSVVITKERSNDSSLSDLSITQTNISPTFVSTTKEYTASVAYEVTSIDIVATKNDPSATVAGDGKKNLNTGDNTFEIVVTAEDNTTTTYKLVVTRAKNDNANLSNLTISGGFKLKPDFNKDTTNYTLTVPNSTKSVVVTGYKEDPNAKSITGDGTISLNTGDNNINVVVTAENGITKKTYKIKITRELSNDTSLKSREINHMSHFF